MTGIYKITSPTGKVYIGQSRNIKRRLKDYRRMQCKSQPGIYRSLKKHGAKQHKYEIEHLLDDNCIDEVLDYHECFFMEIYRLKGINLLNAKGGGKRGKIYEEHKRKLSLLRKGVPRPEYLGENNPFYGKKHTEESLRLMSEKGKFNKCGDKNGRARAIYQMDLEGNIIKEWSTVTEASKETGVYRLAISDALNGRLKTSGGFKWKYKNETKSSNNSK